MISVEGLRFTYPLSESPALDGVDLHVPEGQFCAIVGANGSGKTTLAYALSGLIPHFYHGSKMEGRVVVAGKDVSQHPISELAGDVGLVFDNPFNQITGARFTVGEEVAFGLENLGLPPEQMPARIQHALASMGLEALADRSPYALSGGQQQRLAIAAVIAMQPRLLVLDEPSSQLDPLGTRQLFEALQRLLEDGKTSVVLIEHKLEWIARFAERVLVLHAGRIVADGPAAEVLTDPELESLGVGATRYTQLGRQAQALGLAPEDRSLPVTLEQALEFFQ